MNHENRSERQGVFSSAMIEGSFELLETLNWPSRVSK